MQITLSTDEARFLGLLTESFLENKDDESDGVLINYGPYNMQNDIPKIEALLTKLQDAQKTLASI